MITPDDLTAVDLLIPPEPLLERALGYDPPTTHNPRWVAFYWEPTYDGARYHDGRMSGDANRWTFLEWVDSPLNQKQLHAHNLVSTRGGESEWLILDRKERAAYVAPVAVAREFLRQQWPPGEPLTTDPGAFAKAFQQAMDRLDAEQVADPEAFRAKAEARMRREQELLQQLKAWLESAAQERE